MKMHVMLVFYFMTVLSCQAQDEHITHRKILDVLRKDSLVLQEFLNIEGEHEFFLSSKKIPILTTPFYENIDSLLPDYTGDDTLSFRHLNTFDLMHYEELHERKFSIRHQRLFEEKANKLTVYCSGEFESLVTCEVILQNKGEEKERKKAYFGSTLLYIFRFDKSNDVEYFDRKIIHHN